MIKIIKKALKIIGIGIASVVVLLGILLGTLMTTAAMDKLDHPYVVCSGREADCYADLFLSEISDNYASSIGSNKHSCVPLKSRDIYEMEDTVPLDAIYPIDTGIPYLLHYRVEMPKEAALGKSSFSIVIDTTQNKAYTGASFLKQHGKIPALVEKDPPYLKKSFHDVFETQNLPTHEHLPDCQIKERNALLDALVTVKRKVYRSLCKC